MKLIRLSVTTLLAATLLAGCSDNDVTGASSHSWKGDCTLTGNMTNATTLVVTGSCQFAGIGTLNYLSTQALNFTTSSFTSVTTFRLPNGDELRSTNSGTTTATATGLNINGTETATGGTGQFNNASGTATFTGAVTFTSATTTAGVLTYNGSVTY